MSETLEPIGIDSAGVESNRIERRYHYARLWLKYARGGGVRFRVCGQGPDADLQISDPRRFLTDDQRAEMNEYRREMKMLVMTLDQFALSGRMIEIYSDVLQSTIILAADNANLSAETCRLPVYLASELDALMYRPPSMKGLSHLHEVKVEFDGRIVDDPNILSHEDMEAIEALR